MDESEQQPHHPETAVLGAFPELREAKVLVVDDEDIICDFVSDTVGEEGADVVCVGTAREGREAMAKQKFDVALIDAHLPDGSGLDLVAHMRTVSPRTAPVLITGFPDPRKAKRMEEVGVETLLTKPFTASQLLFTVYREFMRYRGAAATAAPEDADHIGLVGRSDFIRSERQNVLLFARGDIPVLIQGPTGTGKEVIARAIHNHSARRHKQMITINCAAIPVHLEESEFFGHAKGAFTGATSDKHGILECADKSTLFLDEVGDLSPAVQAKLLRVLDAQEFTRVGDVAPKKVDVRFISATNKDLQDMAAKGSFRNDLYYRLKAGMIATEPLVCHKEDIPPLIEHFLSGDAGASKKRLRIAPEALDLLSAFDWPGNVRQLKNTLETLSTICDPSRGVTAADVEKVLMTGNEQTPQVPPPLAQARLEFERNYFKMMLLRHNGNITAAAAAAGMDRGNFSKKLKSLGLDAARRRND